MIPIKDREKIDRIVQFTPAPVGLLSLFVVYEMYLLLWGWCLKKDRSLMCHACIGIWILLFFLFIRRNVIAFKVRNRLMVCPKGNLARCVMVTCWSTIVRPECKLDSTWAVGGLVELVVPVLNISTALSMAMWYHQQIVVGLRLVMDMDSLETFVLY